MAKELNLSEVTDPVFEFKTRDGKEHRCDPFEVQEKLLDAGDPRTMFDNIRAAFGLPTTTMGEAAKGDNPSKPYIATRHECMVLAAALHEFVEGLDVTKKLSALMPRLPASTTSSQASG